MCSGCAAEAAAAAPVAAVTASATAQGCHIFPSVYFWRLTKIVMGPGTCFVSRIAWPVVFAQAGKSAREPGSVVSTSRTSPTTTEPIMADLDDWHRACQALVVECFCNSVVRHDAFLPFYR